ncbi:MAG: response regulator [Magnetococcales bacterium]|nr:response regulator [Magnetococcales bacterium]
MEELPKILVVDDRPTNRIALRAVLDEVEANVIEAGSGNEALTQCLYHDFALILLDVQMPVMDGFEVSRLLRSSEQTRAIPILFLTAFTGDHESLLKAYDAGAVDFIRKPIESVILLSKVRVFLELYNHRRAYERQAALLAEHNARLEEEIRERERVEQELIEARRIAEEANLAKSRFLATMSHEIRTPMNGILGFAQLLSRTELTEKQTLYVKTIVDSGGTLLAVINDILDVSKLEAHKVTLEAIPFSPVDELTKAARLFSSAVEQKGLVMRQHPGAGVPESVIGDPNRLRQVLHNLISNAVKFTEQGEITLGLEPLVVNEESATLRFSVADTGIGIPPDARTRLFAPFVQADNSTTRKYGGTGLGLSICNGLVNLMGGGIELESEVGKGSCFLFTVTCPVDRRGVAGEV